MRCVCVLYTDGLSMDRDGRERAVRKTEPFEQRRTSQTLSKHMFRVGADLLVYGSAVSGKHSSWASAADWSWGCSWACRHGVARIPAGAGALYGLCPFPWGFPTCCAFLTTSPFLGPDSA